MTTFTPMVLLSKSRVQVHTPFWGFLILVLVGVILADAKKLGDSLFIVTLRLRDSMKIMQAISEASLTSCSAAGARVS
ncbi:hypothetical protein BDZ91DRAFT_708741 [Kalaharituber pfeilii]|nr:hypothetical protein BDZ91DRAFT_708741 [Kalaharituber pfeilii]